MEKNMNEILNTKLNDNHPILKKMAMEWIWMAMDVRVNIEPNDCWVNIDFDVYDSEDLERTELQKSIWKRSWIRCIYYRGNKKRLPFFEMEYVVYKIGGRPVHFEAGYKLEIRDIKDGLVLATKHFEENKEAEEFEFSIA